MKPITLTGLVLVLCTALFSCSKEDSAQTGGSGNKGAKIKTYTEDISYPGVGQQKETFNVNYDSQDRVISLVSTTTPSSRFEYTYESDKFHLEIFVGGFLSIHSTFFLTSDRTLVDSSMQYNNTYDTSLTKYVYNSSKQLIQQREYDYTRASGPVLYDRTDYTYNAAGLIITEKDLFTTSTYKYDKVIKNSINVGAPYMPLPVQLPTQIATTDGVDTETLDFTYQFDGQNRLVEEKGVSSSGIIVIKSYTY